jgi:hypothetical protein
MKTTKPKIHSSLLAHTLFLAASLLSAAAAEPPVLPVGLDAYRQWDRWPCQRIGARAYMRSTYDRRGGNEGADASHFLYQLADDFNTALDVAGPGVLYFVRCNHWHGSPWHYEVDGADHLVRETSTADPLHPAPDSVFLPQPLFPHPLTWTWSLTKGADLNWVPMPFERSFRLGYSRTRYGTGYFIYHLYDRGAPLSQPLRSWDAQTPPGRDVLDLLGRAGADLAPADAKIVKDINFTLPPGAAHTLDAAFDQPVLLRALALSAPRAHALALGRARLRITWDDLPQPSVDAPVALFFGAGTLYRRETEPQPTEPRPSGSGYLVKSFPMTIRFNPERVHLACYFPMPCRRAARFELRSAEPATIIGDIQFTLRAGPCVDPPDYAGYFHATYQDFPAPEPGRDLVLLDTRAVEGGGDWSGSFVGTSWIFSHRAVLNTLEGDPRFFFDDSQTPQACGTGTEEWGGGGDYWGGRNMTLPLAGHPCGARNAAEAKSEEDKIESAYRFLLADLMPFGNRAVIRLEHGGLNDSTEHYETVTYWYGVNRPALVKTDELKIADPASERAHAYVSPAASEPYDITSRYEWGVDTLRGREIYPAHTERGRKTQGASEFTLKLRPDNYGVVLRRTLDYAFPNQRAEVFVADAPGSQEAAPSVPESAWKRAGVWYLAGANTCVYSNPKDELGATAHQVQTSNRRFRDDEFIVPRELTRGRAALRVRVQFTPVRLPLFPGRPLDELAWSEIRYETMCWVKP